MAGSILHVYTSPVADGTVTSVVRPSDWNSNHSYVGIPDGFSVVGNNTAGTPAVISNGTIYLAGGNNVTLSQAGQTITISGATAAPAPVNVSAGTASGNLATIVFSNSNGVSFGLNGSTVTATVQTNYLTTAMQSNAATISNVNISAGTTSSNVSAVTFSNRNGVSFGYDGTNISASVVPQSTQTQPAGNIVGSGFTSGGANVGLSGTQNSNGLSLSVTVAAQSVQTQNCVDVTLAGNTSGTLALVSSGTLTIAGGNNITVSQVGNAFTISGPNVGGAQTGISGIADGAGTQTVGTISFANSHGVTFGLSTGALTATLTASVAAQSVQTQASGNIAGTGFTSAGANVGVSGTNNTAGLSLSVTVAAQSNQSAIRGLGVSNTGNTAGNTGISTGVDWVVAGSNNVTASQSTAGGGPNTIWVSGPTLTQYLTTADLSQNSSKYLQAWELDGNNTAGTTSSLQGTKLYLSGGANVTLSGNSNTIVISAAAGGGGNFSAGASNVGNTAGNTGITGTRLIFAGGNNVTVSQGTDANGATLTISAFNQTNQSGNVYASSNTFGTSSGTYDARTISIAGSGAVSVAASNSGWVISAPAQSNQTVGMYVTGNTTNNTSATFDARTLGTWSANGAATIGFSNGSIQLSVPASSSVVGSGFVSITGANNTITISGTYTANIYGLGNTFGTSSGTCDPRSISISGSAGIEVAASNGGWVIAENPVSVSEPFPILTGTAFSSHAPASWWFNRVLLDNPLAVSNINVVKSASVAVPILGLASSGTQKYSYSHGVTVYSRQDYAGNSSNLTTVTTASFGLTASLSVTVSSVSAAFSYVTNSTGGTTSFSTAVNGASFSSWSAYFSGPFLFAIPCVTTIQQGEYFFAHAHSSTAATGGNALFAASSVMMSFSNLHVAPQVAGPLMLPGQSATQASLNPWGLGGGIASAVTTNNSMAGSVISGGTQNNWYMALSNV